MKFISSVGGCFKKELKRHKFDRNKIKIVHAPEVITNDDAPVKAARTKKDSSLIRAISLVREKKCDFVISAGNTGALMAGALLIWAGFQESTVRLSA